jgi:hypothetical protein
VHLCHPSGGPLTEHIEHPWSSYWNAPTGYTTACGFGMCATPIRFIGGYWWLVSQMMAPNALDHGSQVIRRSMRL